LSKVGNIDLLQQELGFTSKVFFLKTPSVDLYLKGRFSLSPIVEEIMDLESDLCKNLSRSGANNLKKRLEDLRSSLKRKFNFFKMMNVFPATMGYDVLFEQVGSNSSE
jgi:hypothetical protein